MDFRIYVLTFDMKNPMCVYYQKNYKTWIDKNYIKIGHTVDWQRRIGQYKKNYSGYSINQHKNSPFCDGCGKRIQNKDRDHIHVRVFKTWKFFPLEDLESTVLKTEFEKFGESITQDIKDNQNFKNKPRTEYFFRTDLNRIIKEMGSLILDKGKKIYSITVE